VNSALFAGRTRILSRHRSISVPPSRHWANQEQGSLNAVQSFFAGDSAGSFAEPDPQGHGYLGDGTFGRFERVDDLDDSPAHHTLRRGKLLCFAPKN